MTFPLRFTKTKQKEFSFVVCTIGLLETIENKCAREERELVNAINAGKCKKLKERVFSKVYKSAVKSIAYARSLCRTLHCTSLF